LKKYLKYLFLLLFLGIVAWIDLMFLRPPPGELEFLGMVAYLLLLVSVGCFGAVSLILIKMVLGSRRGTPALQRGRVKPIAPSPHMPEVLQAKEKKLPKVKATPLEGLMSLDEKVYLYVVDHGGEISWSQASRNLGVSVEELKASVERLKEAKRIE